MRQLEQMIAEQERQNQRIHAQITEQTQKQLQQIQQQTLAAYQRRLDETTEAYAKRIRQFQETVMRQHNAQLEQLQQEADAINRKTQKLLKELEDCNRELREELEKLRNEASSRDALSQQLAKDAQVQADEARRLANETPHEFFFPQEFEIIASHIQDIPSLIEMGMYQAAISDAGCLALEFNLLRAKVSHAFSEWMQAFEEYRALVDLLYRRLTEFEKQQIQTSAGTFSMKPRELDFWSCGSYSALSEKIAAAYNTYCNMDREKIMAYLEGQAGTNRNAIYDLITEGKKWQDHLTAVMNCILSERLFSDQRVVVAQDAQELLQQMNFQAELSCFLPPDENKPSQPWYIAPADEDPINSFDLSMTSVSSPNRIKLHIVPRRSYGLTVSNLYYLTVDLVSDTSPATERRVANEVLALLQPLLQELQVDASIQYIPSLEEPDRVIRMAEQTMSPPPSTSAQMRYLERKYQ
jgi:hypothetical protein